MPAFNKPKPEAIKLELIFIVLSSRPNARMAPSGQRWGKGEFWCLGGLPDLRTIRASVGPVAPVAADRPSDEGLPAGAPDLKPAQFAGPREPGGGCPTTTFRGRYLAS